MEAIESYEHAGIKVEIHYDQDCMSPREDRDGLAKMVTWHRRAELGEEQLDLDSVRSLQFTSDEQALRYFKHERKARVILPLYIYEHSGISMRTTSFHDPWDSGMVGFIYATTAMIKEWHMVKSVNKELEVKVAEGLVAEVEEYDMWLQGQCYGYVLHSPDSRIEDESCWGFIGDDDVKEEANHAAEYMAAAITKLPPTPYEVIVKEVATGKFTAVVGDVEAALRLHMEEANGYNESAVWIARQIEKGITEIKTGISQEE